MKVKKILSIFQNIYFIVGVCSALVFLISYGAKIINPLYTDWLFAYEDTAQHYLGWVAYRYSGWHFPIGMVDNLAYPQLTSVIFTDSIPLFAIPFKILSTILPQSFQYFGLWGLVSFILQGVITAKILKEHTDNKVAIAFCSIITVFAPCMLFRMFVHSSLAGQWVILLGLDAFLNRKKHDSKMFIYIAVISFLSSSIHMYFVLMNGIILLGICLSAVFEKKVFKGFLYLAEYLVVAVFVTAILGGFSSGMDASTVQLGEFGFNLNGFFNPKGWSCILPNLSSYWDNHEGFTYWGFGVILLVGISLLLLPGKHFKDLFKDKTKSIVLVLIVFIIALGFALSPQITLGNKMILDLKIPHIVYKLWSIFRATARVAWVCTYLVEMLTFIVLFYRIKKPVLLSTLLGVALIIQIYDLNQFVITKHSFYSEKMEYDSVLVSDDKWDYLAENKTIRHIVYFTRPSAAYMYSVTDWAFKSQKTVNDFYFARSIDDMVIKNRDAVLANPTEEFIVLFPEKEKMNCLKYPLNYYRIDDFIVGYAGELDELNEMPIDEFYLDWYFGDNLYIMPESGEDTDEGRVIYPQGLSYGPYWRLPSGKYMITVNGIDLPEELEIKTYYGLGQNIHENVIVSRTSEQIILELDLNQDVEDLEIYLENNSTKNVTVKSIHLQAVQ